MTFTNDHSGHSSLVNYIDKAPENPKGNVLEADFDIKFSNIGGSTFFDIVGEEIKTTSDLNENSILRIAVDSDGKGVYLYDGSQVSPINISEYTGYSASGNTSSTDKFRIHAVMNFQTKDIDLDIYRFNGSGTAQFQISYRDVGFYNTEMTTANGLYIRAGKTVLL